MDQSELKNLAPAELDEAGKLLLKAADLIEKRGLAKYKLQDYQGRLCVNGALMMAQTGTPYFSDSSQLLESPAYQRLSNNLTVEPAHWNNHPERTQAEVVAKLRAVAFIKE